MANTNFPSIVEPRGFSTREKHELFRKYKIGGRAKVRTVMKEFGTGKLHSGSKHGPKVTNRKQAIAIALSEQRKAERSHGGLAQSPLSRTGR